LGVHRNGCPTLPRGKSGVRCQEGTLKGGLKADFDPEMKK